MFKNSQSKFLEERRKLEHEVKQDLKELSNIAADMLNDLRYKKIRDIYEKAQKNTVDLVLAYKDVDPVKYKMKMDEYLTELRLFNYVLRIPMDLVSQKDGPKPSFNFMQKFLTKFAEELPESVAK
jgi:hypothetical protein